jgi:hypothetical protein
VSPHSSGEQVSDPSQNEPTVINAERVLKSLDLDIHDISNKTGSRIGCILCLTIALGCRPLIPLTPDAAELRFELRAVLD